MSSVLGSIFGFGDKMKRRLRDAVSNPSDYAEMTADENRNEWKRNPDERSLGFFNPVPLGTMGNFAFRKALEDAVPSMSRRDFLKKSGGIAAGAATAGVVPKLLRKFAAEEKPIADAVAQTAKETPKYKYNSLKEYLDDVKTQAFSKFNEPHTANWDIKPNDLIKERLLQDETEHKTAKFFYKDNLKDPTTGKWINPYNGQPHGEEFLQNIRNTTDDFSPQAKKEMGALKSLHGDDWTHQAQTSEFRHYLDNSGIIQGKPQYRGDRTIPSNEFYWNGKTPIDTQYEHLNPKSSGFNFWDETGGHGLQEGTSTLEELQKIFSKYNP